MAEEFGGQRDGLGGPLGVMIAAGAAGRPGFGLAVRAGAEIIGVEFVEAGTGQAQFSGGGVGREALGAMFGQEMADEGGGQTMDQLLFFMAAEGSRRVGFSLEN